MIARSGTPAGRLDDCSAPGIWGIVYALSDSLLPAVHCNSTVSSAVEDPIQRPSSISRVRCSSAAAISRTEERLGGGNRALKRFSAARKDVHSLLMLAGRFLVALRYWRWAFLYAGESGRRTVGEGMEGARQ